MLGIELRAGGRVRGYQFSRRLLDEPAIVIAADRWQIEFDHAIGGAPGLKGPTQVIAKINDRVDTKVSDVRHHGIEREAVSVNIRDGGKLHNSPPRALLGPVSLQMRAMQCRPKLAKTA
jgi:hypothetical protein